MEIDFITDPSLEGTGLLIHYQALTFNMDENLKSSLNFDCKAKNIVSLSSAAGDLNP